MVALKKMNLDLFTVNDFFAINSHSRYKGQDKSSYQSNSNECEITYLKSTNYKLNLHFQFALPPFDFQSFLNEIRTDYSSDQRLEHVN